MSTEQFTAEPTAEECPQMWVLVAVYEDDYEETLGGLYCRKYMVDHLARQEAEAADGEYRVEVRPG